MFPACDDFVTVNAERSQANSLASFAHMCNVNTAPSSSNHEQQISRPHLPLQILLLQPRLSSQSVTNKQQASYPQPETSVMGKQARRDAARHTSQSLIRTSRR